MSEERNVHDGMPPIVSADNIANGALVELLAEALKRVGENISDVNTSEKAKRGITIKISCDPYPDRSGFIYELSIETKLAGMRSASGTAYIARVGGEYLVVGKNQRQLELEMDAQIGSRPEEQKQKLQ